MSTRWLSSFSPTFTFNFQFSAIQLQQNSTQTAVYINCLTFVTLLKAPTVP